MLASAEVRSVSTESRREDVDSAKEALLARGVEFDPDPAMSPLEVAYASKGGKGGSGAAERAGDVTKLDFDFRLKRKED